MKKSTKEIIKYADYLSETELSENTKAVYLRQAKVFMDFLDERPITKKEAIAYKKHLIAKGYAGTTINLYIVAANNYLNYAGYKNFSVRTERLQKRQYPENIIDKEDYRKLLDYARESGRLKYYYIMRTLALTGIRISELSGCTVEALDRGKFVTSNKGRARVVFLPDKLVVELREYCVGQRIESGIIFRGDAGKAIQRTTVYRMLIHLADMTGIPRERVHPHSFRHLFAITYMEQYSNLFELADILGHNSLETTRIYTETTDEMKREKMDKLCL